MEEARFDALVRKHKDSVYRQMVRVCHHKEDAEDALATALLLAFSAAKQLSSETAFRAWLGTIGKRVCTRMRSHPAIQNTLEYAEEHGLLNTVASDFDLAILKGCVREAVDKLPEIYRDVYLKCELEEATVPQAALDLGITHSAAKSRLLRARTIVRENLDGSICAP